MGQFYDLPTGVPAGMSDAKLPDAQAGDEKGMTNLLAGHAGGNLIYESAGMHASLLGCCLESFVIDNDMLGAILRTVRGIEVDEASLSLEAMREVCLEGPAIFSATSRRCELMQAEYFYPEVADRAAPRNGLEHGRTDVLDQRAQRFARDPRRALSDATSRRPSTARSATASRSACRRRSMRPGNGRW